MLLLYLCVFFHYNLLQCVELENANIHGFLQTEDEVKARRLDYYMNYSIIEVLLSPRAHFSDLTSPEYSILTTPVDNDTNRQENSTPKHTQDPSLTTALIPETTTYISSPTDSSTEGTATSSTNLVAPYITVYPPGFSPDSVTLNTEPTVDPLVAEYAKKWLEEIASTNVTTTLLVPKLFQVFAYDYSAEAFPQPIRRNDKTPQLKISNGQLKNNTFRHQTRPIFHQGGTEPQTSKSRYSETGAITFWHDPPTQSEEPALQRARHTQSTVTKQRLKPGLLLGKATIGDDSNSDDDEEDENKEITSGSDGSKQIMRMHKVSASTKKQWYSDQTEVQKDVMRTVKETTRIEFVRHTMFPPISTMTSTTQLYNKMKEIRQDTYMIVFLIELTRLLATKEKRAVHDVIKHTGQIITGYFKSGKLMWFPQILINVTRKAVKLIKESETDVIQKQAANLHHILRHRSQMLSDETNRIIEYADRLYDNDEGKHLLEALNEFAEYPNTTLSSYWLCTSLINNFLRPYRRLTDTRQRQQLMDSVNKALKKIFTFGGSNKTMNETLTRNETSCETTRPQKERKRKRRHRSHKRKRERKRYKTHRPLPDKQKLMLSSMAPRSSVQSSVLVTT